MHHVIHDGNELLGLTYQDEVNLATVVMDCLSLRWVQGGFADLLNQIYTFKCAYGLMIRTDDMIRLIDYCEHYGIISPELEDTDKGIWDDFRDTKMTHQEKSDEARRMIICAWREVWEKHTALKAIADTYKVFPGDTVRERESDGRDLLKEQEDLDQRFWNEVNRVEAAYKRDGFHPSRSDVITEVSDYMPRNILELD